MVITLSAMRQFAVSRSLFLAADVSSAVAQLGYVQADPMCAPARAQDLILRQRVANYRAGDLEREYSAMALDEAFFINYGFMPRQIAALLHPRATLDHWSDDSHALAKRLLEHISTAGPSHPAQVSAHFGNAKATNNWGGQSTATTQMLGNMHHHGQIRVARRDGGTRVYEALQPGLIAQMPSAQERAAQLVDVLVQQYAPFHSAGLRQMGNMLARSMPLLADAIRSEVKRLAHELPQTKLDGMVWLWPHGQSPVDADWSSARGVRLLSPFDPLVWDRERFELLWGWAYRFEAYTPAPKRQRGHYALPLLVGDQVLGWANLSVSYQQQLCAEIGFVSAAPRSLAHLQQDTEAELASIAQFLGLARLDAHITRHKNSVF